MGFYVNRCHLHAAFPIPAGMRLPYICIVKKIVVGISSSWIQNESFPIGAIHTLTLLSFSQ